MTKKTDLQKPLKLPCGATLSHRLAKPALTEGLATWEGTPTPELERLYAIWSDSHGLALLMSGNIQIDFYHLERPGNVIMEKDGLTQDYQAALQRWATAGTRGGNHFWAQLSHPGRQVNKMINPSPKGPSADIALNAMPGSTLLFGKTSALTVDEIEDLVGRFGFAAKACQEAGFTGVEVHAAHGYLVSQFLSPRTNHRTDDYGGSLANRARFLLDVVNEIRTTCGPKFPIAVKLNSSDFQKGGFDFEDSLQVALWLEEASVDLLELSGGNYEQPKMMNISWAANETEGEKEQKEKVVAMLKKTQNKKRSTILREAYFLDFCIAMKQRVKKMPIMVTGGFRTRAAMEEAINSGSADMIGLGRPLCVDTDAAKHLLDGTVDELVSYETQKKLLPDSLSFLGKLSSTLNSLSSFSVQLWFYAQLYYLGHDGMSKPDLTVFQAVQLIGGHEQKIIDLRNKHRPLPKRDQPARNSGTSSLMVGVSIAVAVGAVLVLNRYNKA